MLPTSLVNIDHMTDIPLPAFDKPPVTEVVFGVGFDPVLDFRMPHVGLYWATIKDEFTRCEHALPLAPIETATDPKTGLPLPRAWLIHKNEDCLIQLQPNWYLFNWRKMEEKQEYPHYESIKPLFQKHLAQFFNFLGGEGFDQPEPSICQLAYINTIPKGQGWETIADIQKILPDLCWRDRDDRFLPPLQNLYWQGGVDLPEESGQLSIKLQNAIQKAGDTPVFRLEIVAQGIGKDRSISGIWSWFDLAHEWIVRGFADLTDREVQIEHWKRTDV